MTQLMDLQPGRTPPPESGRWLHNGWVRQDSFLILMPPRYTGVERLIVSQHQADGSVRLSIVTE